jgi:hypothetical protein
MNYYLLDHKTHALETILLLSILPCGIIIYLVHSVNQADLSQNKKDCLRFYLGINVPIVHVEQPQRLKETELLAVKTERQLVSVDA